MARVTIEDCLENIENRFSLVLLVSKRSKQLLRGAKNVLQSEYDPQNKYIVTALREVAAGKVAFELNTSSSEAIDQVENALKR